MTQAERESLKLSQVDELSAERMTQALITADGIGHFATLADFKASTKVYTNGVHVDGYYSSTDNAFGSNNYYLLPDDGTVYTEQGGVVVQTASGRYYELKFKGAIKASYFGVLGSSDANPVDESDNIQTMFDNYIDTVGDNVVSFPTHNANLKVGKSRVFEFDAHKIYYVSKTVTAYSQFKMRFEGSTLKATSNFVPDSSGAVLHIKRSLLEAGTWASMLVGLDDVVICGNDVAPIGLKGYKVFQSTLRNILCMQNTNYGAAFEEMQYSTIEGLNVNSNKNGIWLGRPDEESDKKCIDNVFINLVADFNTNIGIVMSSAKNNSFYRTDCSRNGEKSILFKNINIDGSEFSTALIDNNKFYDFKVEQGNGSTFINTPEGETPVSIVFDCDVAQGNQFFNASFLQVGYYYLWVSNIKGTRNKLYNPRMSDSPGEKMVKNLQNGDIDDYSIFYTPDTYNGLFVTFQDWIPSVDGIDKIDLINSIATTGNGGTDKVGAGNSRCVIKVDAGFQYSTTTADQYSNAVGFNEVPNYIARSNQLFVNEIGELNFKNQDASISKVIKGNSVGEVDGLRLTEISNTETVLSNEIFIDGSDGKLKYKDNTGTIKTITTT